MKAHRAKEAYLQELIPARERKKRSDEEKKRIKQVPRWAGKL
jgi:hypothetical protein